VACGRVLGVMSCAGMIGQQEGCVKPESTNETMRPVWRV